MASNQQQPTNSPTKTQVSSKEERTFKIQDNKPLLAVIAVIGLIMLTAIGVGLYALISGVTGGDDESPEEEQVAQASSTNSEDEDSSENSESTDTEGSSEENDSESEEDTTSEDSEDGSDSNQEESSDEESQDTSASDNDSEESSNESDEENDSEDSSDQSNGNEDSEENSDESSDNSEDTSDNSADNSTDEGDSEGNVDANGAASTARRIGSLTQEAFNKSLDNQARINESGVWYATDYEPGDIIGDSHEVQLGDTLWEIAEGVYGDGSAWTKIEAVNSDSIGYLPNGEHALITPGTVLVLPSP
jgi:FlaG/FlaF family flagellin (archaellin)